MTQLRPDFLIIGAEKAGTTWLHDVLSAHPDLFLPSVKEIHFFNRFDSNRNATDNFTRRGVDWYERHFDGATPGQIVGEATPMYLCDPDAPTRIQATLPEARFIVLLREPVSRAWSHYRMARAKKHIDEDLDVLIAAKDPRILGRGLYAEQLKHWMSLFPPERFLVLFFEEVMSDPAPALTKVADWLGVSVDPLLAARPEESRNAASGYRSAGFYNASVKTARALRNFPLTRGLAEGLKASGLYDLVKNANRNASEKLNLTAAQTASLRQFYRDDLSALSQVVGRAPLPWAQGDGRS